MTIRLLGLTDEQRLEFEQTTGIKTETAQLIIDNAVEQAQTIIDESIKELQTVVGPHGSVTRLQAGGINITRNGIGIFTDGVLKTSIDREGNLFVGSNIDFPAYTTLCAFVNDQTYNNEEMGAGDLLVGDNSAANMKYDASAGQLQFRNGTTVNVYVDTDGLVYAGAGNVVLGADGIKIIATGLLNTSNGYKFVDSGGDVMGGLYAVSLANTSYIQVRANGQDGNIHQITSIDAVASNTAAARLTTDSGQNAGAAGELVLEQTATTRIYTTNVDTMDLQAAIVINESGADLDQRMEGDTDQQLFYLDAGNDRIGIGNANPTAKLNVEGDVIFNDAGADKDFRVESDNVANMLHIDASADQLISSDILTVDNPEDRVEIGADHFFPTRNASNKDVFLNEANQDMDVYIRGTTDDELVHVNAGLDGVGIGGDAESGYKLKVTGKMKVTDGLVALTNANDIFFVSAGGASTFVGTINGAPVGAAVTYNVTSGNENVLVPQSVSQLGKLRLYNTTRGNSALILSCNTGTNVVTLTANAPANWVNGDTITIASQTVTGSPFNMVDIEITSGDFLSRSSVFLYIAYADSGGAGQTFLLHPFESYAASKLFAITTQTANGYTLQYLYKLTSNVVTVAWGASGAATATLILREAGILQ